MDGKNGSRGLATLETALVLPLFIFLLFVFLEFGRYMWIKSVLNEAATEGARLAMLYEPSDRDVEEAVRQRLTAQGVDKNYLITIGPREPGKPVAVTVEADFDLFILPDGPLKNAEVTRLRASSVMTHVF
jgi:Flp pilus assembly protein TadG